MISYLSGDKPAYLTIVARGTHGGYMEHTSSEDEPLSTKKELLNRIRTSLGGRAAEIVYYGETDGISTGASGDLAQASKLAYAMICKYGMDAQIGLYFQAEERNVTDEVKNRINVVLNDELSKAIDIIKQNRYIMDSLVDALMKKNKLTSQEISEVIENCKI